MHGAGDAADTSVHTLSMCLVAALSSTTSAAVQLAASRYEAVFL